MQKSYKKALTIGIATFSAVALIATGTAAFILMTGGSDSLDGSVTVGEVEDNSIVVDAYIGDAGTNSFSYIFDSKENDTTGRVQWDGSTHESLTNTITVSITPAAGADITQTDINNGYSLSYTVEVVATGDEATTFAKYVTTKGASSETAASEKEFLQLTSGTSTGDISNENLVSVGASNAITMPTETNTTTTFSVNFAWGSYFNYQNPSEYYDGDGASVSLGDSTTGVKGALNKLHLLNGIKLKITVNAVKNR